MQPDPANLYDVIVIGAGAAGMMAAASAGGRGKRVLLIEKNTKTGVKILMSGGTRCNITHNCAERGIVEAFGRNGKFLHSALAALPPLEVIKKIEEQGVETKIESTGKIFPVSNKAIDVRDAVLQMAKDAGARLINPCTVQSIEKNDGLFTIITEASNFQSRSIIITTGGKSYPGCGTTGDGYRWAIQFGHKIVDTIPALTPILSDCEWAQGLKGITIERTDVTVLESAAADDTGSNFSSPQDPGAQNGSKKSTKKKKPRILSQHLGSFLFTHWGFSGPSVLNVSREVARHADRKRLALVCDFLPEQSPQQFAEYLQQRKTRDGKQAVANLLNEFFPRRLGEALLSAGGVDLTTRNAELSKLTLSAIAAQVKSARFPINGTLGFEKAEVTAGGVSLKEVDSKTMQSKLVDGLYFAGEILDLDGPIGGFNFQSAFSTGWLAGQSV